VAINDALPLKADHLDAIANVKCFWCPGTPTTKFWWFQLHSLYGATLFSSHQHHLHPSIWQSLVDFRLLTSVCNAWQRSWMQNSQRAGTNSGPVLSRLWTKVHEVFRRCRRPLILSKALANCLHRRKIKQMYKFFFAPNFSGGTTPTFLWQIVSLIYCPPFGKVWFSSVCWSPRAKTCSQVESRNYGCWVRTLVLFYAICGPKFMTFSNNVEYPSYFQPLVWFSIWCFVQKIFTIKPRNRRKTEQMYKVFWCRIFWEGRRRLFYSRLLARFTVHHLA